MKYRKIPAECEAICFTGEDAYRAMLKAWGEPFETVSIFYPQHKTLLLLRKQGSHSLNLTDWVIRQGDHFYRCTNGVFLNNYAPEFDQPKETPENDLR